MEKKLKEIDCMDCMLKEKRSLFGLINLAVTIIGFLFLLISTTSKINTVFYENRIAIETRLTAIETQLRMMRTENIEERK